MDTFDVSLVFPLACLGTFATQETSFVCLYIEISLTNTLNTCTARIDARKHSTSDLIPQKKKKKVSWGQMYVHLVSRMKSLLSFRVVS